MKKIFLILLVLITALVSAGCFKMSVGLGEEFSLSRGKGAVVSGENLQITFLDVLEDSRCPSDVTCVWEGRARSLVRIVYYDNDINLELSEPGLTDQGHTISYLDYLINYHLLPYPQSSVETAKGDYRLQMTITKLR